MSPTKKRMYLAVMAVCGMALLLDRLVLRPGVSGPEAAEAAAEERDPAANATAHSDGQTQAIPELPFPRGLAPVKSVHDVRDLFAPADNGRSASTTGDDRNNDKKRHRPISAREAFTADHRLDAVLNDPGLKIAVVNGRWVRIGESVAGCTLSRLVGTQAFFVCSDGPAVLELPGPGRNSPR